MVSGALVGGGIGSVAGLITVGLLKLTGTSMEEVRYWQYKWKADRHEAYREGFEKSLVKSQWSHKTVMQDLHDIKVGVSRPNLDELSDEPTKKEDDDKKSPDSKEEVKKSPETTVKEPSEKK